jgi:hypothetical protein
MEVGSDNPNTAFDVDETCVILGNSNGAQRWRISFVPTPHHDSSVDDDTSHLSSLPMVFVLIKDNEPSLVSPDAPPVPYYRYDQDTPSWILGKEGRRMLWVPPDLRHYSDSWGGKFVFGSSDGLVTIVQFSDVESVLIV